MARRRPSILSDLSSEFMKIHRANAGFGDLVRELDYADVRARARWAPVPPWLLPVLALQFLYVLLLRLPLRAALRLLGAAGAGAVREDLAVLARLLADFAAGLAYWLAILLSVIWVEAKIVLHHGLVWALLAVGYVIAAAVIVGLALFVLSR